MLLILLLLPEAGVFLFSVAVAAVAELSVAGARAGVGVVVVADLGTLGVVVLEPCCSCWSVGTIVDAGSVWDIASFDP